MEFESTEITAQVYETLKNINLAISRLQDRSVGINSVNSDVTNRNGESHSMNEVYCHRSLFASKSELQIIGLDEFGFFLR